MIDERFEQGGDPSPPDGALDDQRRLLELELIKIRNEATAARLEARAAEIELMIRRLGNGNLDSTCLPGGGTLASGTAASIDPTHLPLPSPVPAESSFRSWDEVRQAHLADASAAVSEPAQPRSTDINTPPDTTLTRIDAGEPTPRRPKFLDLADNDSPLNGDAFADSAEIVLQGDAVAVAPTDPGEVSIESPPQNDDEAEHQRRKPAAWLVSAVVHVSVLLLLATISLQTQRPKDQVALSASAEQATEVTMETFTIESIEPQPERAEPTPSETEYELSPAGEIAAANFVPDAPPAPPSTAAAAMASGTLSSASAMALKSDSDASIQFCGVEGGGNHFVYLVDSSGSMGDGFNSARAELLSSIEVLKPDQRFYVVFFDAASDYMRLTNADEDEPRSVYATPQNKAALKRWAMRIAMDKGRAPYEPLRFALNLKPDVIFLLSDGEFPQGIEDMLRQENKVENLFGDSHPISIVHTIGYHSKEGESRMRRIAEQNQGQYRYIPKP